MGRSFTEAYTSDLLKGTQMAVLPGSKVTRAWNGPFITIQYSGPKFVELYLNIFRIAS
jgi:hypothetical protein